MKKHRILLRLLSAAIALLLLGAVFLPSTAQDASQAAIQKLEDRLAKIKADQDKLERDIASAKDNITDTQAFKKQLDQQIQNKSDGSR